MIWYQPKFLTKDRIQKLYKIVVNNVLHGPYGVLNAKVPCTKNRRCRFFLFNKLEITKRSWTWRIYCKETNKKYKNMTILRNGNGVWPAKNQAQLSMGVNFIKYILKCQYKGSDFINFRITLSLFSCLLPN